VRVNYRSNPVKLVRQVPEGLFRGKRAA
jgi:hypothetical protein